MSHGKPSVVTPLLVQFGVLALSVAMFADSEASGQCPPPCPQPPCVCLPCGAYTCTGSGTCGAPTPRRCDVYCQQQLLDVLEDEVVTGLCRHIRIPAGVCVDICNQISIGSEHSDPLGLCPLRIEILGTLRYVGTASEDKRIFKLANASDVIFDGGGTGTITSIYLPANYDCEPPCGIVKAFHISDPCSDITIQNLTLTNLGSVLEVANGEIVTDLVVSNVHATGMSRYGFFISNRTDGSFTNCSVNLTVVEHPFRLYAFGSGLDVTNCWSYNSGKTGLWVPEGDDVDIDGFSSDKWLRVGPDNGLCELPAPPHPCATGPLTNVFARDMRTTDYTRVEMGVQGGCLVNLCSSLTIGRNTDDVEHLFGLNDTNWDDVSGAVTIAANGLIDHPLNGAFHPVRLLFRQHRSRRPKRTSGRY